MQRLALQREGVLKQTHAEFRFQHPQHRPVEDGNVRLAVREHGLQFVVQPVADGSSMSMPASMQR